MTQEATGPKRLFILEQGGMRPLDYALSEGFHELPDCGVNLRFDGDTVELSWQGFGPTAFVLPGARRLQKGRWTSAERGARVSWAGREWTFVPHVLPGEGVAPVRGVCLNSHGTGRPVDALLLEVAGKDRGNFFRFRTERSQLSEGIWFKGTPGEDGLLLELIVGKNLGKGRLRLDGRDLPPGTTVTLTAESCVEVGDSDASAAVSVVVVTA